MGMLVTVHRQMHPTEATIVFDGNRGPQKFKTSMLGQKILCVIMCIGKNVRYLPSKK